MVPTPDSPGSDGGRDGSGSAPAPAPAPALGEPGTVHTNGVDTRYTRRGEGPAVVFVHGMAMNRHQFEAQAAALSDEFTTVTYDVRGHGDTGGSDRERYDVALYAADLHALLVALDLGPVVLCGLSMGGCVAQVYAAEHPERVAGVVLADTFTAAPLPLWGRLLFANLRVLAALDRVVRYPTLNRLQAQVGNLLAPGVAGDAVTVQHLMEAAPLMSHAEFAKVARSVAGFPASGFDAGRIRSPVLVLHGEHVPRTMREMHEQLAGAVTAADAELAVVPGAGHASNVDNPEAFTLELRGFARRAFAEAA